MGKWQMCPSCQDQANMAKKSVAIVVAVADIRNDDWGKEI